MEIRQVHEPLTSCCFKGWSGSWRKKQRRNKQMKQLNQLTIVGIDQGYRQLMREA